MAELERHFGERFSHTPALRAQQGRDPSADPLIPLGAESSMKGHVASPTQPSQGMQRSPESIGLVRNRAPLVNRAGPATGD